jgi:hypothetical protein
MNHSFLFEPGVWVGAGTFWTADAQALTAEARTVITHREECWLLAGSLHVLSSPPVEFVNHYSIEPPQKELAALKWTAETSATGKLQGTFSVVGPSILSVYRSIEGSAQYQGTESLTQLNPHHYEACGVLLLDGRRLSSWRVALTRSS